MPSSALSMMILATSQTVSGMLLTPTTFHGAWKVLVRSIIFLKNFWSNALAPMWSSVRNVSSLILLSEYSLARLPMSLSSMSR